MNKLLKYFENNKDRKIDKWMSYFDVYDRHFNKYRNKKITVLEFGVQNGGSMQMWQKYFGRKAKYIGVDIDPRCKSLEDGNTEIYIGDQEDRKFLKKLMKKIGPVDVVIEDGGHTMKQQIHTFQEVFPYVNDGGVFLIEDLHTSYWKKWGGGYKKKDSFIEFAKNLVDQLNAWYAQWPGQYFGTDAFKVDKYTKSIRSISFYDSIAVFEKASVQPPERRVTGEKELS